MITASGLAVALALVATNASAGPPTMRDILTAAYAIKDLGGVALPPQGKAVAWDESSHDPQRLLQSARRSAVYVQRLGGGARVRVTAGAASDYYDEENPAWSPDGRTIAFLSDARSPGQQQIFLAAADGTHVRQVGNFKGNLARLTWSPAGNALAVLYIGNAHRKTGALAPGGRDVGVIGTVVDEQRLALVDAKAGAMRFVTPAERYVYEYGWSPDGTQIAATYATGNGDNNWWVARLARVDVRTGAMHDLLVPAYQIDDPQWSPDGKSIAIIGGIMSDFGSTGGDVYLVDAQTGSARDVTAGAPVSVQSLRWNDASSLDVVAHVSGAMHLMRLDAGSGRIEALTDRPESLWSWSSAAHGAAVALVRASFDDPPEIWAGAPERLHRITNSNAGAVRLYGKAVSLQWKSGGFDAQGWLIYPLAYDSSRHYPMVTIVHGGPSAESVPGFGSRNVSALSSQGYFVFMPNPRGSFGQGEAFTRANVKDFGYGDWRDILAGVDAAIEDGFDRSRSSRVDGLELRRIHGDVGRDADLAFQGDRCRSRHRELAVILRSEQNRSVDDPVLRRFGLSGSRRLREELADYVHRALSYAGADPAGRTRRRGSGPAGIRVLARHGNP